MPPPDGGCFHQTHPQPESRSAAAAVPPHPSHMLSYPPRLPSKCTASSGFAACRLHERTSSSSEVVPGNNTSRIGVTEYDGNDAQRRKVATKEAKRVWNGQEHIMCFLQRNPVDVQGRDTPHWARRVLVAYSAQRWDKYLHGSHNAVTSATARP